jgi:hypothetical protein
LTVTSIITTGSPMSIPTNVWLIGNPHVDNPTWNRLINTSAFMVRPAFTLRTTPDYWGDIRNQWANTFDAALIKKTRIREGMNAEFRVETFNVTNTPVFYGNPDLDPTSPTFGALLRDNGQSNSPRQFQLGLRLTF